MVRLPDFEELDRVTKKEASSVNREISMTEDLLKRLLVNIAAFKKIEENNLKLRKLLLKNQDLIKSDMYDKFNKLTKSVKEEKKKSQHKHKSLLREYEELKLELNKRLAKEKEKNIHLTTQYKKLLKGTKEIYENYEKMKLLNNRIMDKLTLLSKKSLANEDLLKQKTILIRKNFEDRLKKLGKLHLDKEIEYKTQVESLTEDLKRYYGELKESKKKYYEREKDIKEKFKEILN